ncbi:E3 ubiquitin-protein ligase Topors [Pelomyxa schiedti]|nr:E3 ubiquitin-protein ligase Topors [Pelomyxa schiedti]
MDEAGSGTPAAESATTTEALYKMIDCPICLLVVERPSVYDSCYQHIFCFSCAMRWGKTAYACPLCKRSARSVITDIDKSDPTEYSLEEELVKSTPDFTEHYRSLTAHTSKPPRPPKMTLDKFQAFRRKVYIERLKATPTKPETPTVASIFTLSQIKAKPAPWTAKLLPWIKRELQAILQEEDVTLLSEYVMGIIKEHELSDPKAISQLKGILFDNTDLFVHELRMFASSPFTMETYDKIVKYAPLDPRPANRPVSQSAIQGTSTSKSPTPLTQPNQTLGEQHLQPQIQLQLQHLQKQRQSGQFHPSPIPPNQPQQLARTALQLTPEAEQVSISPVLATSTSPLHSEHHKHHKKHKDPKHKHKKKHDRKRARSPKPGSSSGSSSSSPIPRSHSSRSRSRSRGPAESSRSKTTQSARGRTENIQSSQHSPEDNMRSRSQSRSKSRHRHERNNPHTFSPEDQEEIAPATEKTGTPTRKRSKSRDQDTPTAKRSCTTQCKQKETPPSHSTDDITPPNGTNNRQQPNAPEIHQASTTGPIPEPNKPSDIDEELNRVEQELHEKKLKLLLMEHYKHSHAATKSSL